MKPSEVFMTWQEVLERKELQDLPFKIELNAMGKIEMSPATNVHGYLQGEISGLLRDFLNRKGQVATECSVMTSEGVKVADVTWNSKEFREEFGNVTPFPRAPEICVEIISPSNSATMPEGAFYGQETKEILEKIGLYIAAGAFEVWTCNLEGEMRFYDAEGAVLQSNRVPEFPKIVTW
jgi:Uma2 family endonuclease